MASTIAIIQSNADFADRLAHTLSQDGHDVLPIAHTLSEAYKNFSIYNADICVIDGNLPEETVMRLSDMFTLIEVPHIINYNEDLLLRRLPVNKTLCASHIGAEASRVNPPMTQAISLAVWELHVSLQISRPMETLSPAVSFL